MKITQSQEHVLAQGIQLGSPVSSNTDLECLGCMLLCDVATYFVLQEIFALPGKYFPTHVRVNWEGEARGEKVGRVGGNLEETRVSCAST